MWGILRGKNCLDNDCCRFFGPDLVGGGSRLEASLGWGLWTNLCITRAYPAHTRSRVGHWHRDFCRDCKNYGTVTAENIASF